MKLEKHSLGHIVIIILGKNYQKIPKPVGKNWVKNGAFT